MYEPADQSALIRGLRSGDRGAWTTLYDHYSGDVWRYVARLLGSDSAAVADVVQETFLAAARSARHYDADRGLLWQWLSGIAHHRVLAWWRQSARANRVRQLAETGAPDLLRWLDRDDPQAEEWRRRELADLVRSVLAELPVDQAELLAAKYLDERSLAELAGDRGGSVEAIKSKLARARREFRAKFEQMTGELQTLDRVSHERRTGRIPS